MPVTMTLQLEIQNEEEFLAKLRAAKAAVGNLTIPLHLIAKDFYKSEQAIFMMQSKGQYVDLSPKYKVQKRRAWGFVYPILKASGRLEASITSSTDADSISEIINQDTLVIGTRVPYAGYHQSGTKKMPRRPFLFIGPEAPTHATSAQVGRPQRWAKILDSYVKNRLAAEMQSGG